MTSDDRFEQLLADVLADVAPTRQPDRLVPEILRAARRERRWPRWLALIKEPPMRISSRVAVGSPTLRLALVMALTMALILATAAAVVVGASPQPSPVAHVLPPFGPAANGSIVFQAYGDIYLADANADIATPIVTGPDTDHYPWFSHDGKKIAFGRGPDNDLAMMVANTDGTDVHEVMATTEWAEFMPSDKQLVATRSDNGRLVISVVNVDGSDPHDLGLGDVVPRGWVMPRPPDGQEIIFTGHPDATSLDVGIYGIRSDGTGLRTIGDVRTGESQVDPLQISQQDPVLSSDGKTMAYWSWESKAGASPDSYVHVRDLTTGKDQLLDLYPFHDSGSGPHFSPDGKLLLYEAHSATVDGDDQLVVAPVDGSQPARPIGPSYYYEFRSGYDFSPDGTKVYLTMNSPASTQIIDVATGDAVTTKANIPDRA